MPYKVLIRLDTAGVVSATCKDPSISEPRLADGINSQWLSDVGSKESRSIWEEIDHILANAVVFEHIRELDVAVVGRRPLLVEPVAAPSVLTRSLPRMLLPDLMRAVNQRTGRTHLAE